MHCEQDRRPVDDWQNVVHYCSVATGRCRAWRALYALQLLINTLSAEQAPAVAPSSLLLYDDNNTGVGLLVVVSLELSPGSRETHFTPSTTYSSHRSVRLLMIVAFLFNLGVQFYQVLRTTLDGRPIRSYFANTDSQT